MIKKQGSCPSYPVVINIAEYMIEKSKAPVPPNYPCAQYSDTTSFNSVFGASGFCSFVNLDNILCSIS